MNRRIFNDKRVSNRYQLEQLLGTGGMGTVYRGTDLQSGQPVAIKFISPEKVADQPGMIERLSREAEALRALNHPNIVRILATGEENSGYYIVMEFLPGGSLRDILKRSGQLTINTTIEIALDIADALTRVHRLDIVHRDLKPSNVLLSDDSTARLADFGLARMRSKNITQGDMLMGTLVYISPEVYRGMKAERHSDIWSFGVMLFEMLTGRLPFDADNYLAVAHAITTQPTPNLEALRPDVPIALVDLIYRMLDKDPGTRIPSVRLVGAELESILAGSIDSQPPTVSNPQSVATRFGTPTPQPLGMHRHNLPMQTTPFIGRTRELSNLADLFRDPATRLVTLLGPGGIGKTRLALEAARAQLLNFEDGVFFVPLAPINSVENIPSSIADAVGFQFFEGMALRDQISEYFHEKKVLLVLDNFEHILAGTGLIYEILQASPNVKLLATSREKLNLQDEIRFRIEGLDFPAGRQPTSAEAAEQYSAICLFVQSAKRACPGFELETADLKSITRICRSVNGTPLGIILAAAWLEMFSPTEIATEISQNLDFLESEVSNIPARHRSMRAVFDSTWRQLSPDEREIFMKLAVFRGGFRRAAAQAIAGANLRVLITFVSKSLLHRDPPSGRYFVHELLRQYAEEQLEVSETFEAVNAAHCTYYTSFMAERLPKMLGPRQMKALDEIEAEFENVRQAWHWAVDRKDYAAIDQAWESLFKYSDMRSREHDGVTLIGLARERLGPHAGEEPHPVWGRLLLPWHDLLLQSKGPLSDDREIRAQADTWLAVARKRGDKFGIAHALILQGHFTEKSKPIETLKKYTDALELAPRMDDSFWLRIRIGYCYRNLVQYHKAIEAYQRSFDHGREMGEQERMGWSRYNMGEAEIALSNHDNAINHFQQAIPHFQQIGTRMGILWSKVNLSIMRFIRGDFEKSQSLTDEVQKIANEVYRAHRIEKEIQTVRGYLSLVKEDYRQARCHFEKILLAFPGSPEASLGLAFVACGMGENGDSHLWDALRTSSSFLFPAMVILCLPAAALFKKEEGDVDRAVELLALAKHHPQGPNCLLDKWPLLMRLQTELRETVRPEVFEAAWTRGRSLDLSKTLFKLGDHFQVEEGQPIDNWTPILKSPNEALVDPLSDRELEVLQLIADGLSRQEIATRLVLSLNTVKTHARNIYSKLGVNNQMQAVGKARGLGLLDKG